MPSSVTTTWPRNTKIVCCCWIKLTLFEEFYFLLRTSIKLMVVIFESGTRQTHTKEGNWNIQTHTSSCLDRPDTAVPHTSSSCPSINQSIYPTVHSSATQPSIHSCSQPAFQLTHPHTIDPMIDPALGGSILSWMASLKALRHNGLSLFVQFISKVARPCRALTRVNSPFSSAYMITAKRKEGALKKALSSEHPVHMQQKGQWSMQNHL